MGLVQRSLPAAHIVGQVVAAAACAEARGLPRLANVVFMGMGEPADNVVEVRRAVNAICGGIPRRQGGLGLSRGAVTVSTVAPRPDAFEKILFGGTRTTTTTSTISTSNDDDDDDDDDDDGDDDLGVLLAWSLHAADAALRKALVPTASASPQALVEALAVALRRRPDPKKRRVLVEVVLIRGVNDGPQHADAVADLLRPVHDACFQPGRKRTGVLVK
jgi:23S rRNA (adenine2503-C2)-methyltransferase